MHWRDTGIIISTRRHGESSVIVDLLTRDHGRHSGLVRGGRSKRNRPVLQLGNRIGADWRARLPEHLGMYIFEPEKLRCALIMRDAVRLIALQSVCMLVGLIAEREPHPGLYDATELLIDALAKDELSDNDELWRPMLVMWELGLLGELGFGLDLTSCAATGVTDDLIYVSPRSSRAVSRLAGEPYHERLLPLPSFISESNNAEIDRSKIKSGLKLTGYFLQKCFMELRKQDLPEIRQRLYSKI